MIWAVAIWAVICFHSFVHFAQKRISIHVQLLAFKIFLLSSHDFDKMLQAVAICAVVVWPVNPFPNIYIKIETFSEIILRERCLWGSFNLHRIYINQLFQNYFGTIKLPSWDPKLQFFVQFFNYTTYHKQLFQNYAIKLHPINKFDNKIIWNNKSYK